MQTGIILLAAGNSSRLGQSKQLVKVNGTPLLRKSAQAAQQTNCPVVVVLGSDAETHLTVIADLNPEVVINPHWQTGMGSSIKAGLTSLLKAYPGLQAVMVLVCDQPYLSANHLLKLLNESQKQGQLIIASVYSNTVGVPAIFKKEFFPNLLQLANEAGARKIIQQFSDHVISVPFKNGEIDLDTPQDLQHLPKE